MPLVATIVGYRLRAIRIVGEGFLIVIIERYLEDRLDNMINILIVYAD